MGLNTNATVVYFLTLVLVPAKVKRCQGSCPKLVGPSWIQCPFIFGFRDVICTKQGPKLL